MTGPLVSGQGREPCTAWHALELTDSTGTRLFSDLGELVPARLTTGRPGKVKDVSGEKGLRAWEPYACSLAVMRSAGVRGVNAWAYAEQPLPGGDGEAEWLCTRGETWRGTGARVLAQFLSPGARYGAVAARAEDVLSLRGAATGRAGRGVVEVRRRLLVPARGKQRRGGVREGDRRHRGEGGGAAAVGARGEGCAGRPHGHTEGRGSVGGLR